MMKRNVNGWIPGKQNLKNDFFYKQRFIYTKLT